MLNILLNRQLLIFGSALLIFIFSSYIVFGAYRAYYLQIFDQVLNNNATIVTGFSPKVYASSFRKDSKIKILVKASWLCGNNTSFKPVCPMPKPLNPKFMVGDKVKIILDKHLSTNWIGTVELILWREDLRSNIYGLRFEQQNFLYGNYYEKDLSSLNSQSTDPLSTY